MRFGREHLVQVVVFSRFSASRFDVFEDGFLPVLVDFHQFEAVLDFDIPSFEFFLKEIIA